MFSFGMKAESKANHESSVASFMSDVEMAQDEVCLHDIIHSVGIAR